MIPAGTAQRSAEFFSPHLQPPTGCRRRSGDLVRESGHAYSALLALVSLAFPFAAALAQSDQFPPTAHISSDDFSPIKEPWEVHSGVWIVSNGTYVMSK